MEERDTAIEEQQAMSPALGILSTLAVTELTTVTRAAVTVGSARMVLLLHPLPSLHTSCSIVA